MPNEYDAFTEGVELGGLRTKNDIKVMLCYLLSTLDAPISKTALNSAIMSTGLVNFFEVNEALRVLRDNSMAAEEERDGDLYYSLTDAGRAVAPKLETDVPSYIRDRIVPVALNYANRELRQKYTKAEAEKLDKGYQAVLSLYDGDTLMMKTVLYTADKLQANAVCEAFCDDPAKLYSAIIDAVTQ